MTPLTSHLIAFALGFAAGVVLLGAKVCKLQDDIARAVRDHCEKFEEEK